MANGGKGRTGLGAIVPVPIPISTASRRSTARSSIKENRTGKTGSRSRYKNQYLQYLSLRNGFGLMTIGTKMLCSNLVTTNRYLIG